MSARAALLEAVAELRGELRQLSLRVDELAERIESAEDFELVEDTAASSGLSAPSSKGVPSDTERSAAAKLTGQFFVRALTGQPRGDSGRSSVRLQNRYYVVIRDFRGQVYTEPARVFNNFAGARAIIAEGGRGNQFGDSIFAGFASQWEARCALIEAGFEWPATLN